jgi:hypothetical protein
VPELPTRWGWTHPGGAAPTALRSVPTPRGQSGTRWTWPPSARPPLPASPPSVRRATAATRTVGTPTGRARTAGAPFATARSDGSPTPRGAPPTLPLSTGRAPRSKALGPWVGSVRVRALSFARRPLRRSPHRQCPSCAPPLGSAACGCRRREAWELPVKEQPPGFEPGTLGSEVCGPNH